MCSSLPATFSLTADSHKDKKRYCVLWYPLTLEITLIKFSLDKIFVLKPACLCDGRITDWKYSIVKGGFSQAVTFTWKTWAISEVGAKHKTLIAGL